jgi:hypothetical protein
MGFAEYFKQWTNHNFQVFEENDSLVSADTDNLIELINLDLGGDLASEAAVRVSSDTIQEVFSKLDIGEIEKRTARVEAIAKALGKSNKIDFILKYLTTNRDTLKRITEKLNKLKVEDNFKEMRAGKFRAQEISNTVYKVLQTFNLLLDLPEKDETSQLLDGFKDTGFFIKVDPNQKGNRFKITKIGQGDGALKSNQAEVTFNNGENKIFTKEDILKFIKNDPSAVEKGEELVAQFDKKGAQKIVKLTNDIIANDYAKLILVTSEKIEELPDTEDGREFLDINWKPLLDALGQRKLYNRTIERKEEKIDRSERPSVKKKNIIKNRLLSALNSALLPPMSNGEVSEPGGDYFKLFKKLEVQNSPWLELSISQYFKGSSRLVQFNQGARKKESAQEEDQLAYLGICKIWIIKYVESEVDGSLQDKDTTAATNKTKNIALEKEKEIRNYYLSRDFNMSNTRGIQLKPDLTLPLYVKIKLAVNEADRIKESPLRNIVKGLGQLAVGLLAGIPDATNQAVAEKNAAQNRAIFNGLLSIVTAGAYSVGKQEGRDFEKASSKITNKLRLDVIGLTPYKANEGPKFFKTAEGGKSNEAVASNITEDGIMMVNPEGTGGTPGEVFQTPDMLPSDMDPLSLAGPGKKKKKAGKEKLTVGTRVANFKDFLKGK